MTNERVNKSCECIFTGRTRAAALTETQNHHLLKVQLKALKYSIKCIYKNIAQ